MKLHIDINHGIVEVEGDDALVQRIYEDFRERLLQAKGGERQSEPAFESDTGTHAEETQQRARRRRSTRARPTREGTAPKGRVSDYTPSIDKNLNTTGLVEYYHRFSTKNHPERILIFARFLEEKLGIRPCSGDQIFTCYREAKAPIPEAFVQALRDASGKYGYVEYKSPTEIEVTVRGLNRIEQGAMNKKADK
jgi:hypothetical protein